MSAATVAVREHLLERYCGPASVVFVIPAWCRGHVSRALGWLGLCAWPGYDVVEGN